jgi:hypothetical protein
MSDIYTISQFIEYLQSLADGHGDKQLTLELGSVLWDVDIEDIVADELNKDDDRIYVTIG